MNDQRLDVGDAGDVHIEAIGEPGRRTFRMTVEKAGGTASLWFEKFQVVLLGNAIEELLSSVSATATTQRNQTTPAFVGEVEARVGAMSLGFDAAAGVFTFEATELENAFQLAAITFTMSRAQLETLQREIEGIVAAGRPLCVLCGTPLTGAPHFCPQQNGHAHVRAAE